MNSYGRKRPVLIDSVLVRHRTKEHGRRYAVDMQNKKKLENLVEIGKMQIAAHMRKIGIDLGQIEGFLSDSFDGSGADATQQKSAGSLVQSC